VHPLIVVQNGITGPNWLDNTNSADGTERKEIVYLLLFTSVIKKIGEAMAERGGFISDPPKLQNPRTGVGRSELLSGTRKRKLK
jgi:hypothetical protein